MSRVSPKGAAGSHAANSRAKRVQSQPRAKSVKPGATSGSLERSQRKKERNHARQLDRLLQVRDLLASHRYGLTAKQVHAELDDECTERTVERALGKLKKRGEAASDKGRWTYTAPNGSMLLKQDEIIALLVAETRLLPMRETWLGEALTRLRNKALATMDEKGAQFCTETASIIAASPRASAEYGRRARYLSVLQEACAEEERVRIVHRSGGAEPRERLIEPRRLLLRDEGWYVVARDVEDGEHKKFALHRIDELERPYQEATPDASFDPDAYIAASFGLYHGERIRAVVEFDGEVAHLFHERKLHDSQETVPIAGGIRVSWEVSGTTDLVRHLASFGGHVRVIEPPELAAELRELHRAGLEAQEPVARVDP